MRCLRNLTVAMVLFTACARPALDPASQADHTALQGKWGVVSAESNGEPPPPGLLDNAFIEFAGDRCTLMGKQGEFTIDAKTEPRRIEFIHQRVRQMGIYQLTAEGLSLCVGPADAPPVRFETAPFTDHTLLILRRLP